MRYLSSQVESYLERSSWIRKMFEAGIELKARFGEDMVCDFSLGNPDLPPPKAVKLGLEEIARDADKPFAFGYMPNFGYPDMREDLARFVTSEQGVEVPPTCLVVTCGAAGAINALLRAVLDPGDEVLCPAPFFVEYGFYTENHGGRFVTAPCKAPDFSLDIDALEAAITDRTRVVIINSPNNPSGAVYSADQLKALGEMLTAKSAGRDRPIYLASDEPYRFLTYDGVEVPSVLDHYADSVVVNSFSKNLSLAGERVGYALVNPAMEGKDSLLAGIILANRILGFVNAPAIGQKLVRKALGSNVDISVYDARRKLMAEILDEAGYEFAMPGGGFYFFPKAPGGDDSAFCARLQEERILAVPGKGFGFPGHFRLTFCVGEEVIARSAEGFRKAMG